MESTISKPLLERGEFIWRPFTQAKTAQPPIQIAKGQGAYLYDNAGIRYFDASSSWWVTLHGHCHPVIAERISHQAFQLDQAILAEVVHAPAAELAERLVRLFNWERGRVFYSDNGSTAVETALKIALQYWHNRAPMCPKRKIISFQNGYHGDTFGAMAVSGPTPFNRPFWPLIFQVVQIPPPFEGMEEVSLQQMQTHLATGDTACFIFEPTVQGVGGMRSHSKAGLADLISLCKKHEVITIADEVLTGFGRSGPLFACDVLPVRPDITCLSKGLTGGFLPLGATVCSEEIYEEFLSEELQHAFLHGHSYCGNPLGCAAALASLDLLEAQACKMQREMIQKSHQDFAEEYGQNPGLERCSVAGTILAIEYKQDQSKGRGYFSSKRRQLSEFFLRRNILIRPQGNLLYLMPPYCASRKDLCHVYETIIDSLKHEG